MGVLESEINGPERREETLDSEPASSFTQSRPGVEHPQSLLPGRASGLAKTLSSHLGS